MFSENYSNQLNLLHKGKISYSEFIKAVGNDIQYKEWCKVHAIKPCEDNAELYFDMHGFEESEIVKEFIEPVI